MTKDLFKRHVGLTRKQAEERLALLGPNVLPESQTPPWWIFFLRQFQSPLIYLLLIAALISLLAKSYHDALFIVIALTINALIGGYQEWQYETSIRSLRKLLKTKATALRDGQMVEIDAENLVVDDIVWLESGNRVPADVKLLSSHALQVDESLLTGESLPVEKDGVSNRVYAGSTIASGRGEAIVVATGRLTKVGSLALEVIETPFGKPPLLARMERFTNIITWVALGSVCLVALAAALFQNYTLHEIFLFSVALAVSAVPEGLPVAVTVALSVVSRRMAKRGVIVRRLSAVEGLGSCSLIASDKTGTLTCNELTVREIYLKDGSVFDVTGQGFVPEGEVLFKGKRADDTQLSKLALAAVLCNEGQLYRRADRWVWRGDAVDVALLSFCQKMGVNQEEALAFYPQVNEIPYEPERRFSASFHQSGSKTVCFVKGAPEKVLGMCAAQNQELLQAAESMALKGFRVLAFASGMLEKHVAPQEVPSEPEGLEFIGFAGMIDPARKGVKEAIQSCKEAGVGVWMITGDHPVTAFAIAKDLGLATTFDQVMCGDDLKKMTPQKIKNISVFARVSPHQKLLLVNLAKQAGQFVAVTGDGVNDAPALKAANIGVAMGKGGTDVARESAELVISDDNFSTIVSGIEEGRVAYANIRKVIYLLVSTGVAEVLMALLSLLAGLPIPLLPVQLLWLNLVTNGIQDMALALEPGEKNLLKEPPRAPSEPIFDRLMIVRTTLASLVMGGCSFLVFYGLLASGWEEKSARNLVLLLMVLFENVHIGNCRSEKVSAFKLSPLKSPVLAFGALTAFGVHLLAMWLPIGQKVLQTEPVTLPVFLALFGISLTVLLVIELHKMSLKR